MNMHLAIVILTFLLGMVSCKHDHHPVPTYFWKLHENGTMVDRSHPEYDDFITSRTLINRKPRNGASAVKLRVWPDTVKNGGKVTILWEGVEEPQNKDFVAVYCPFYDDVNHYLDYKYVYVSTEWEKGYGHFDVTLYNFRESCHFKYWKLSKDRKHFTLTAVSNQVNFDDGGPQAPLQGHIALGNNPTEMRVMWVSGQVKKPPVVRYGLSKDNLSMKEHRYIPRTYTADSMCQGNANGKGFWHPGITYDVLLTNLKPNTRYYYSYGTEDFMSPIANFTTALPAGDKTPFTFIVYGDMGVDPYPQAYSTAKNVRKDIDKYDIKFVSHFGDISYARGYAYIWEQWGYLIQPYATLVPYMLGIGNHEYDHTAGGLGRDPSGISTDGGWKPNWFIGTTDSGGECSVPLYKRYHMPENGNALYWFSFDYGMIHMIHISTEHDFTKGSPQIKWLENDLKNIDRKKTPWVFIGGHRPMYNSEIYDGDIRVSHYMRQGFEDLMIKYKVDLALWAHMHAYERTCKVNNGICVKGDQYGITHLTIGNAGKQLDGAKYYKRDWSLVRYQEYGYGRITIANSSAMFFESFVNKHAKVQDSFWLYH